MKARRNDLRKTRIYFADGHVEHFRNDVFAFAVWLACSCCVSWKGRQASRVSMGLCRYSMKGRVVSDGFRPGPKFDPCSACDHASLAKAGEVFVSAPQNSKPRGARW